MYGFGYSPLEALYIMSTLGLEKFDEKTSLRAALASFSLEGLISNKVDGSLMLTEQGLAVLEDDSTPAYRRQHLEAIQKYEPYTLIAPVDAEGMKEYFASNELLISKEIPERFLFWKWTHYTVEPSEKLGEVIENLKKIRQSLRRIVYREKLTVSMNTLNLMYAFPSVYNSGDYANFKAKVIPIPDPPRQESAQTTSSVGTEYFTFHLILDDLHDCDSLLSDLCTASLPGGDLGGCDAGGFDGGGID